jgi:DNA-binding response OmpR family regulator
MNPIVSKTTINPDILLIEDEAMLAEQLIHFLSKRGFSVTLSRTIKETYSILATQSFNLLILDRLLPDGDSLACLDDFKQVHHGEIIILSALGRTQSRIDGYDAGADIYLAKPVDLDELLAIVRSFSKRSVKKFKQKHWQINDNKLTSPLGVCIQLSSREYLIIQQLINNAPNVVKKVQIIELIGVNYDTYDIRSLDTTLYRIRNKIKQATAETLPILTYHGVGYSWKEI